MGGRIMKSHLLGAISAIVLMFGSIPQATAVSVSLELALVVDISGSVDGIEFGLQRDGYRDAFLDSAVQSAISALPQGLAVSMFFFSTTASGNNEINMPATWSVPVIDWTPVSDTASSNAFAAAIGALADPRPTQRGDTNIAAGIEAARKSITGNSFTSNRQVIDVSSDGIQNVRLDGTQDVMGCNGNDVAGATACLPELTAQRDAAGNLGITINGLPILTEPVPPPLTLTDYFNQYVITPDGFIEPAVDFNAFKTAVRNKILAEVVPIPAAVWVDGDDQLVQVDLEHFWVRVTIGGTDYAFDPSIKMGLAAGITSHLAMFDRGTLRPGARATSRSCARRDPPMHPALTDPRSQRHIG